MSHVSRDRTCREEVEEDKGLLGLMEVDQVGVDRGVERQVVGEAVVEGRLESDPALAEVEVEVVVGVLPEVGRA